ncbi:hypothetical protein HAX54_030616 [Datura stramonium]|uniref:Uncharacterized protein n=1 Tax=Datura stramonium TaxID=4076 RepID=A0ABS8SB70_DATST|nr:hypothetical protein [Datura stramonium]
MNIAAVEGRSAMVMQGGMPVVSVELVHALSTNVQIGEKGEDDQTLPENPWGTCANHIRYTTLLQLGHKKVDRRKLSKTWQSKNPTEAGNQTEKEIEDNIIVSENESMSLKGDGWTQVKGKSVNKAPLASSTQVDVIGTCNGFNPLADNTLQHMIQEAFARLEQSGEVNTSPPK